MDRELIRKLQLAALDKRNTNYNPEEKDLDDTLTRVLGEKLKEIHDLEKHVNFSKSEINKKESQIIEFKKKIDELSKQITVSKNKIYKDELNLTILKEQYYKLKNGEHKIVEST